MLIAGLLPISLLLALGCAEPKPPPPEPPPLDVDGGTCQSACDNADVLGCPSFGNAGPDEVEGTRDDELCAGVCLAFTGDGVDIDLDCLTGARTCEQYAGCD